MLTFEEKYLSVVKIHLFQGSDFRKNLREAIDTARNKLFNKDGELFFLAEHIDKEWKIEAKSLLNLKDLREMYNDMKNSFRSLDFKFESLDFEFNESSKTHREEHLEKNKIIIAIIFNQSLVVNLELMFLKKIREVLISQVD